MSKNMKKQPSAGPRDNLDWLCERFMRHLHTEYAGHKAEISSHRLVKIETRFCSMYRMKPGVLLDAVMRRGWLVPQAANTYHIDYTAVRK